MSTRNFRVKNGIDIGSAVTIDGSSGIITATTFIGDGSALTNVTSTGSGIEIKDDGATVGVAATIEFGANIDVTPLSAGIVTVTAPDQGISGIDTTTTSFFNDVQIGGAVTATTFIGDGSGLTGVVGSGSGVVVEEDGTTVGTAGTINFVNLTVSPISAGIVTVSTQSADDFTAGSLNVTGVSTFGGESNFNDNINISTGSTAIFGSDLLVYRQPTGDQNSVVAYKGSNDFEIHSDEITLRDSDDSRSIARFTEGSTTFYGLGFALMNLSNNNVTTYTSLVVNGGITAGGNSHSFGSGSQLSFTFGTKNQIKNIQSKDFEISNTYPGKKLELTAQGGVELSSFNNGTPSPLLRADTGIEVLGISTFYDTVNLNDGATIQAGESLDFGTDFSISRFSNQNKARIQYTGPGDFTFEIDDVDFRNSGNTETLMTLRNGGGVSLYHDNQQRFVTTGYGATVYGTINASEGIGLRTGDLFLTGNENYGDPLRTQINIADDLKIFSVDGSDKNYIETDEKTLSLGVRVQDSGPIVGATLAMVEVVPNNDVYYGNNSYVTLGFGTDSSRLVTEDAGVSIGGTVRLTGGLTLETNNPTIVGASGTISGEIKQIGGAPFFYDGNAWREFVLSSGTSVTQPADTDWDNVVFRSTFDTNFTDAKFGATPTYTSTNSSIVGSPVKIGTGAFRNIGGAVVGAGVSFPYRSEYDFTGSWTIEFWAYHDQLPDTAYTSLISQVSTTDGSADWTFGVYNNGGSIIWYWANENSSLGFRTLHITGSTTFNTIYLDKWTHYTLVREGDNGSIHLYINGTETVYTISDNIIDNDIILSPNSDAGLGFGAAFGNGVPVINTIPWNQNHSIDVIFDDARITCGVGTAGQRYTSVGLTTAQTFTPSTTALPTTGTLSSVINPPGDKYGEITLGSPASWTGTSGVTVTQESAGNYRLTFTSSYTNLDDYFVLTQPMDQGFASYVGVARSTDYVDFTINRQSDDSTVDTGSLSVQIKNHI